MASRILLDRYVYEDIYPAFKEQTDEKEITADINCALLNRLVARGLVLTGSEPLMVADIGCGPCDTLLKYLRGVRFDGGFAVRATDFIAEYADSETGEALHNLAAAQAAGSIRLGSFAARAGDAFGGNLSALLAAPGESTAARHDFRIVFASHLMYHADGAAAVYRIIHDISHNLLAEDGICILYHIANTAGTFQEFRARFGSQAGMTAESNTGAVTIDDPPAQIRRACDELTLPLNEGGFTTWLRFGKLGDEEWNAFRNPSGYDALGDANHSAYEDLKRLYFIVQRAPLEFAADSSRTGLDSFLREIRPVIERNEGALPLAERLQVFIRPDAVSSLNGAISDALTGSLKDRD